METTELCTQRSAQELLAEFKATGRQEPFEEIVRRYAGMVYHVCLQVTKNSHDAEDATQAVFLTLAVQAKTSKEIRCLGPWLQQVGHRLSLDLRKSKKRRQTREEKHGLIQQYTNPSYEQPAPLDQEELRFIINEELNKLPAKYRLPLILYYFGGLSRDAMSKELHLKAGTLGARLHRGRAMLGTRLAERGVLLAEGSLTVALVHSVQTTITDALITTTCQAATQYVACGDLNIGVLPIQVVGLVKNAVRAAILAKLKTIGILLLVAGTAVAAGAEVVSRARPLDLHFNLPSELGDRILPLLQPIPIPKFSDATPKVLDSQSPAVANAVLANQTTRGPRQEGGGPGFSIDYVASGLAVSGMGGDTGPGSWVGTSGRGVMPFTSGGLGVGSRHPAAVWSGPVLQASTPSFAGSGNSVNSWVTSYSTPQPINGAGSFRSTTTLQSGGMATARPTQGTVVRLEAGSAGKTQTYTPPPVPGGNEPIIHPFEPPVVQNPPPSGPPGIPSGPPPSTPPVLVIVPPVAPPPVVSSGTLVNVVVLPTNMGQIPGSTLTGISTAATTPNPMNSQYPLGVDTVSSLDLGGSGGGVVTEYVPLEQGRFISTSDTLRGYGKATQVGSLNQNGQVIADGYNAPRTLDLSSVSAIENSIDNPAQRGTNGWYAKYGGKLTLPPLDVTPGTATYTWGEQDTDPSIDLVNSVRLRLSNVTREAPVTISLLALDRAGADGVPALPKGHTFIGLWEFNAPDLQAGKVELNIRYDDNLARELNLNEQSIKVWRYEDGNWEIIWRTPQDMAHHLITGETDSLTYFAVSSPEPSGMLIFATSVLFLARRRRRQ